MNLVQYALMSRPKPTSWRGEPFELAEEKLDGWRVTLVRSAAGDVHAFGRKEHVDLWPRLQHHADLVRRADGIPRESVIDGELIAAGRRASDVPSLFDACRDDLLAEFRGFAVPVLAGESWRSLPPSHGRQWLESSSLLAAERVPSDVSATWLHPRSVSAWVRDRGVEDVVLKASSWALWYKVKRLRTLDAVVVGVIPGKGKFRGMVGSLTLAVYDGGELVTISNAGGMSDEVRRLPASDLIGRVVEVEYDSVQSRGRLRFAQFLRFRDDKPATECALAQVEGP